MRVRFVDHIRDIEDPRVPGMVQGHSKNPSGDDCNGFGSILAEVLARLGHGQARGANEG
jgi:hypothetical protein